MHVPRQPGMFIIGRKCPSRTRCREPGQFQPDQTRVQCPSYRRTAGCGDDWREPGTGTARPSVAGGCDEVASCELWQGRAFSQCFVYTSPRLASPLTSRLIETQNKAFIFHSCLFPNILIFVKNNYLKASEDYKKRFRFCVPWFDFDWETLVVLRRWHWCLRIFKC